MQSRNRYQFVRWYRKCLRLYIYQRSGTEKKKNLPAATGQAQIHKNIFTPLL